MIYMNELIERCDNFIKNARITVSQFCQKIELSRDGYYSWRDGDLKLSEDKMNRIAHYLESSEAQALLEKAKTFLPVTECANITGVSIDKIRRLCKKSVLRYEQSSGGRLFVHKEDLKKYVQKRNCEKLPTVKTAKDQLLAFGGLHSGFDIVWKPVLSCNNDHEIFFTERYEYDNRYWIASAGYVYNTATGKILGTETDCESYVRINLLRNGERETPYLHILVAYHFCPNCRYKEYVHHIDGEKKNNNADNLLWVTKHEHDECHRLMRKDKKAYRKYVRQLQKENRWK